jgi:MscS family membrane protein
MILMISIFENPDIEMMHISIEDLLIFFILIFLSFVVRFLFLHILDTKITALVKKTRTDVDDQIIYAVRNPVGYFILLHGFYFAILSLHLPDMIGWINIADILDKGYILCLSFIMLYLFFKLIDVIGLYVFRMTKDSDNKLDDQLAPLLIKSLRIFVIIIGVLFIIQNFGYSIASLLAGLGIGGLAFALAAKDTIGNLFGSFTIFSDKPFHQGDWIRIGDVEGTVEEVGFRSTRIRRFDQAQVVVPNSHFTKNDVTNFSAMKKRRIKFNLGVTYGTSPEQMTKVVEGIKQIIKEDHKFDHTFSMVHFTEFGDFSLNIFIYCFTKTTVWDEFLSVREEFNLKIMQLLEELEVEIAFPSQMIYFDKASTLKPID